MKAKKYLNHIFKPMSQIQNKVKAYDRDMVNKAIELAEQEAEERMREKAHKIILDMMAAIFRGNMPRKIADEFIQKLNEE